MIARTRLVDWRSYTSTLALALSMQRAMVELLEAAHAGDSDALLEQLEQLTEMARAMADDFGAGSSLEKLPSSV